MATDLFPFMQFFFFFSITDKTGLDAYEPRGGVLYETEMSYPLRELSFIPVLIFFIIYIFGGGQCGLSRFLAHLCELLPSLGVRRPSVNFFKNLHL